MIEKLPFIEIRLDNPDTNMFQAGELIKGEVFVRPLTMDIGIQTLACELKMEVRGRLEPSSTFEKRSDLLKGTILKKGQQYTYPFQFTAPRIPSYMGKNVSLLWFIQTNVLFENATVRALQNQSLLKLNLLSAIDPNRDFQARIPINIRTARYQYLIKENALPLHIQAPHHWITFALFAIIGVTIAALKNRWVEAIIGVILATGLYRMLYQFAIRLYIGEPLLDVENVDDENILMQLRIERNHRIIKRLYLSYQIREEVVDQRGTSPSTHDERLFQSKEQILSLQGRQASATFRLPENDAMGNFKIKNVRIYWMANLKIETHMGLHIECKRELLVKKKIKPLI